MNLTLADYDHFSPASKVVAGVVQQHVSRLEFTGVSVSWCVCIHTNTQILPMGTCASFQGLHQLKRSERGQNVLNQTTVATLPHSKAGARAHWYYCT